MLNVATCVDAAVLNAALEAQNTSIIDPLVDDLYVELPDDVETLSDCATEDTDDDVMAEAVSKSILRLQSLDVVGIAAKHTKKAIRKAKEQVRAEALRQGPAVKRKGLRRRMSKAKQAKAKAAKAAEQLAQEEERQLAQISSLILTVQKAKHAYCLVREATSASSNATFVCQWFDTLFEAYQISKNSASLTDFQDLLIALNHEKQRTVDNHQIYTRIEVVGRIMSEQIFHH